MKYMVSWTENEGMESKEAEVEAESRWAAVVEAAVELGLDGFVPMQQLFTMASVRKVGGGKKVRESRFDSDLVRLMDEAAKKLEEGS